LSHSWSGDARIQAILLDVGGICVRLLVYQGQYAAAHILRRARLPQALIQTADVFRIGVRQLILCLGIDLLQGLQFGFLLAAGILLLNTVLQDRVPGRQIIYFLRKALDVAEIRAHLHKIAPDALPVDFVPQALFGQLLPEGFQLLLGNPVLYNQPHRLGGGIYKGLAVKVPFYAELLHVLIHKRVLLGIGRLLRRRQELLLQSAVRRGPGVGGIFHGLYRPGTGSDFHAVIVCRSGGGGGRGDFGLFCGKVRNALIRVCHEFSDKHCEFTVLMVCDL